MKKFILSICCLFALNIFIGINAIASIKGEWKLVNNNWFFNEGSAQLKGCTKIIDGQSYSFTQNGVWIDDKGYDEVNKAKGMDTVSIVYKLEDMSIYSMCQGPQKLKSESVANYGMILVDAHDYNNMSSIQLMQKNWKTDLKIVKNEDGSVSLRVNN